MHKAGKNTKNTKLRAKLAILGAKLRSCTEKIIHINPDTEKHGILFSYQNAVMSLFLRP